MALKTSIECVLFDLDGTLIDTAPDFIKVMQRLCAEQKTDAPTDRQIYQTVSDGARALVELAFAVKEGEDEFPALRERLLDLYEEQLANTEATLYPGMAMLLDECDKQNIAWGIVTNKPEKYTRILLSNMALLSRCRTLICPEQVEFRKPHPEPIFMACQQVACNTERTVYIGDHQRDMQAAKSADVIAIAASYGYLGPDAKTEDWYADFILKDPENIIDLLNLLQFA